MVKGVVSNVGITVPGLGIGWIGGGEAGGVGVHPAAELGRVLAEPGVVERGFGVALVAGEFVGAGPGVARVKLAEGEIVEVLGNDDWGSVVVQETVVESSHGSRGWLINLRVEAHEGCARRDYVGSLLKGPCRGRNVGRGRTGIGYGV